MSVLVAAQSRWRTLSAAPSGSKFARVRRPAGVPGRNPAESAAARALAKANGERRPVSS